jgi:hypothetical protein
MRQSRQINPRALFRDNPGRVAKDPWVGLGYRDDIKVHSFHYRRGHWSGEDDNYRVPHASGVIELLI